MPSVCTCGCHNGTEKHAGPCACYRETYKPQVKNMKITIEVSEDQRMAVRERWGKKGKATREEMRGYVQALVESQLEGVSAKETMVEGQEG